MQLVSKISNLCGPDPGDPPTLQTDGRTDGRHAIARLPFALSTLRTKTERQNTGFADIIDIADIVS